MNIGGYEIGQVFHVGAKGPMWMTRTRAGVALLALRSADDGDRLLPRWKAWSTVESAHVVRLRDVVRSHDGRWALVQDYVAGRSLDAELGSPDLRPLATRRQILDGIAAGLSALHAAGICHGDLTPANVMITPEGRAVIVDIMDELGEGEGTPGWSLGKRGMECDRECLRMIASRLELDDALEQLGLDAPHGLDRGSTPLVADPPAHEIVREPVDPEQVIADLRAAALREDTVSEDGQPRREKSRTRIWGDAATARPTYSGGKRRLGLMIVGALAIIAGAAMIAYTVWRAGAPHGTRPDSQTTQASPMSAQSDTGLCNVEKVTELIGNAIRVRDQAVIDADPSGLDAVLGGELLTQDTARIQAMINDGITVRELSSRIEAVTLRSCEPGALEAYATLVVTASQTCANQSCQRSDTPESTELLVRVDPVSRKVVAAAPANA